MNRLCKRIYIPLLLFFAISIVGGAFAASAEDFYLSLSGSLYQVDREGTLASINGKLDAQGLRVSGVFDLPKNEKLLVAVGRRNVIPNSEEIGGFDLFITDLNGSFSKQVTEGLDVIQARWSPDGRFVYVTRDMKLYLADADKQDKKLISEAAFDPSWSSDGDYLVYSHFDDPSATAMGDPLGIAVYDLAAKKETVYTRGHDDCRPVFSRDAKRVLFYSALRTRVASEYLLNLETGAVEQITNIGLRNANLDDGFVPVHRSQPLWSKDGKTIVFYTHYAEKEIWVLKLEGNKVVESKKIGMGESPRWIQDGNSIAFLETGQRVRQVRRFDLY